MARCRLDCSGLPSVRFDASESSSALATVCKASPQRVPGKHTDAWSPECLPYAGLIIGWFIVLRATCRRQVRGGAGAFGRSDDGVDTAAAHQGLGKHVGVGEFFSCDAANRTPLHTH